ncbi:YceI family protein [Thalassotalea sediminis]|uniref:YceI family protein n=1 Tax=Thalassotalea sediminis TaxID=1759089 RepID=UPI0025731A3C|nr:YceI family protein [Thalassotalea sediminis]
MKKTIAALLGLMTLPALADWQLVSEDSSLNFTTFKKEHVAENHTFESFNATIADDGKVMLSIDLASVNTNIAIRDQRMQEHLFATTLFPNATFAASISPKILNNLKQGEIKTQLLKGEIALHGNTQSVELSVNVSRLSKDKILVTSAAPLLVKAKDFDLVKGINQLQKLAGLPSISHTVPVTFTLSFTQ